MLNVVLADATAPIQVSAWDAQAVELYRVLQPVRDGNDSQPPAVLNFHMFKVGSPRHVAFPHCSVLCTVESSRFELQPRGAATPPFCAASVSLNNEVLCLQFKHLEHIRIPGCINVRGVVGKVRPLGNAKKDGTPMTAFELLDAQGQQVECVAHGRHAEASWLCASTEVVVYFAVAQAGRDGRDGSLWLYSSAHVVILNNTAQLPAKTGIVVIPS